jgi:4-alpha-glucanotransferase
VKLPRLSGILLHPTSLPGRYGIGDVGPQARRFVDFLAGAGQGLWQVLPLGPTGYGDSPYQCFSAFAGNPLLVSLEDLADEGWLSPSDLAQAPEFPAHTVDYGAVIDFKLPLLRRAYEAFAARADAPAHDGFAAFCRAHAAWLDDFALFMALKSAHGGRSWDTWDPAAARREPEALDEWRRRAAREIEAHKFTQWAFFRQWLRLRRLCHERRLRVMGDIPIFVAHDSADVWAHPELFRLGADGRPAFIAGVPPDYFSATGQCWGNPLYRWEMLERTGYSWWIERFRQAFELVDLVRVDHFRGFEAFWEIPGGEDTAVNGRWVKAPGEALFAAVQRALGGELPIVAENLGVITDEVEALRHRFGFPGMAILQFAFGIDEQAGSFRPHTWQRDLVAYTGTHDNDTLVGWWNSTGEGDSTRTPEDVAAEKALARLYLGTDGTDIHWVMIRTLLASVAGTAVMPLQDVLGVGGEGRMNLPSRPAGNWRWRVTAPALGDDVRDRLRALVEVYGRLPPPLSS